MCAIVAAMLELVGVPRPNHSAGHRVAAPECRMLAARAYKRGATPDPRVWMQTLVTEHSQADKARGRAEPVGAQTPTGRSLPHETTLTAKARGGGCAKKKTSPKKLKT